jgi:hypothetical protein
MTQQYYVRDDRGRVSGPHNSHALKQAAREGRLRPSWDLSTDQRRWTPAAKVPQLFASPEGEPPPATAAPAAMSTSAALVAEAPLVTVEPTVSPMAISWSGIELGPDLPVTVFTSSERWHPERIGALALYCSDGRWGEAFDEFCHKHLQIPRYDRWAVPGGPAWLAPRGDDPDFRQSTREQLDFLVRVHELEQIVLITHFGCAYYGHRMGRPPQDCLAAQTDDVRNAAAALRQWYPGMQVDTFLAMRSGNCLTFHALEG